MPSFGGADAVIRVFFTGNVKELQKAITDVDKSLGGMVSRTAKVAGGVLLGVGVIDKAFDITRTALDNTDRLNDALADISTTVSPDFAQRIEDVAFDMSDIGLSAVEVGELAAHFANLASAAGIAAPDIARMTPDILTVAAAISAVTGKTVDEVVDALGKAASGNEKPIRDLGVDLDAIKDGLSPTATFDTFLDRLLEKYPPLTDATAGLEEKQNALNAKFDNLTTKIGPGLEILLSGIVDFFTHVADDIPRTIDMFEDFFGAIFDGAQTALSPLARIRDILEDIATGPGAGRVFQVSPGRAPRTRERDVVQSFNNFNIRNGLDPFA